MNMPQPPDQLVGGGAGEFLISHIVRETAASARTVSLAERLGVEVAVSATAHALAVLASENASRE
jgi:hypothetical protein